MKTTVHLPEPLWRQAKIAALEDRKDLLSKTISRAEQGILLIEHTEEEGAIVFERACKLGLEGIVSKRKGSRYVSGRSSNWIKCKNPASRAVRREEEEDRGKHGNR